MSEILRDVWDRFQIIGRIVGDYAARFSAALFYYLILAPFALIARSIDPLEIRTQKHGWKARKPVGTTLEEARSQS